jgi:hypothetical protein
MIKKLVSLLIIVSVLSSCNTKLSDKDAANQLLRQAKQLVEKNELNGAKISIDSIHQYYPKELATRKKANTLYNKIVLIEQRRNLAYLDSVVIIAQHESDSAAKNFVFEKDEKYQGVGNYIPLNFRTELNTRRTYLKTYVQENGELYFSSVYYAKKPIYHQSVKVAVGDTYLESPVVGLGDGNNHSFEDEGERWETVIYKGKENTAIVNFIAQNADKKITVTLQGKSNYSFVLQQSDIKSIIESLHLSVFLSDLHRIKKEQIKTQRKILILEQRLSVAE